MDYLINRLKEPSSHAGLATIALALGAIFPQYAWIANLVASAFGGTAFALPQVKQD